MQSGQFYIRGLALWFEWSSGYIRRDWILSKEFGLIISYSLQDRN